MIGIYKIVCLKNNKVYVGSSRDLKQRKTLHFKQLKSNTHHNSYLQNSYNKYGKDNFRFQILQKLKFEETLYICEQIWFNLLDPDFNIEKIPGNYTLKISKPDCDYYVVSPEGITSNFKNIRKFCRDNCLDFSSFYRVLQNKSLHHKGWTLNLKNHKIYLNHGHIYKNNKWISNKIVDLQSQRVYKILSIKDFCKAHDCHRSGLGRLLRGEIKSHRNFVLEEK